MSVWIPASQVFLGGTDQIKRMVGTRVRPRTPLLSMLIYDPVHNRQASTDLALGHVGIVANPLGSNLLIAFASIPGIAPTTLTELQRSGNFKVVVVNEPTFKIQFEVERK